jgi:Zn-dependent protease with chaperone function
VTDTLDTRARRILRDIDPGAWEHPADRAALMAVRRIPVFDQVLKTLFGVFGEKPIRLAFQANAVRVGPRQFPEIWHHYVEVCETLDVKDVPELFISQTPLVNAGAYGMDRPFIVLNSGAVRLLNRDQLTYLMGHELGHVLSGHVLYRTMIVLLMQLATLGFPVIGLAARVVLMALLEWQRKSELSADRAGLLALQQPEATLSTMMKLAGGGRDDETDLNEFLVQADQYRDGGDAADMVFKVLNLLGATHPFHVLRAAELRDWCGCPSA